MLLPHTKFFSDQFDMLLPHTKVCSDQFDMFLPHTKFFQSGCPHSWKVAGVGGTVLCELYVKKHNRTTVDNLTFFNFYNYRLERKKEQVQKWKQKGSKCYWIKMQIEPIHIHPWNISLPLNNFAGESFKQKGVCAIE